MLSLEQEKAIRLINKQIDEMKFAHFFPKPTQSVMNAWLIETEIILNKYLGKDNKIFPLLKSPSQLEKEWYKGVNPYKDDMALLETAIRIIKENGVFVPSQDFGLLNLEFNHSSTSLDPINADVPPNAEVKKTSRKDMIDKVLKITDHKLISMLIYGLIVLILMFLAKKCEWMQYFVK